MTAFITTWETTGPGETITLPLINTGVYNATVDWGDSSPNSSIASFDDSNRTHTYTDAGTYTVSITGSLPGWGFGNTGDKLKIRTVEQWGNEAGRLSFGGGFYGCENLIVNATDDGAFGNVNNMLSMFQNAYLANPDTTGWEVGNVLYMQNMFYNAIAADPDVSGWNVASVVNMQSMFFGATAATPDVSLWNVGNVTNMQTMFLNCSSADPDVSEWDVSKVQYMASMFAVLNGSPLANPDVSKWDVSSVTSTVDMFKNTATANPDVSGWNVSNVTDMTGMFSGSAFSTGNYEKLLASWSQLTLNPDVAFHAGAAKYRNAAARAVLTDTFDWTVTDGGADGSNLVDGFLWYGLDGEVYLGDGTLHTSLPATGAVKIGAVYGSGLMQLTVDGVKSAEVAYDGSLLDGTLDIFRGAGLTLSGRRLQRWSGSRSSLKAKIAELMS